MVRTMDESVVTEVELYKDWLSFARIDYESAKYLCSAPFYPRPLSVICYHCQQAAEKAVKALIVYFGSPGGLPKVHDISFLLNQVGKTVYKEKNININEDLRFWADSLTKYGVSPRYPNEIEVDEAQVTAALSTCEKILAWVDEVIAADFVK